jgi:steroid 5-alpha reductase family enzyme
MLQTWLHALPYLLGAGFLTWLASVPLRNVTIVDTLWSLMFVIAAFAYAASTTPLEPRAQLLLVLVTIWGLRLALYLGRRTFGHEEDRRYQNIRKRNEPGFT